MKPHAALLTMTLLVACAGGMQSVTGRAATSPANAAEL